MNTPIKNPCTENWDEMSERAEGRFCAHCQKSVIDFTQMSDGEVIAYMKARKGEKVCGRISYEQIERLRLRKLRQKRSWSKPLAAAFGALLASIPFNTVSAQQLPPNPTEIRLPSHTPKKDAVTDKVEGKKTALNVSLEDSYYGDFILRQASVRVKGKGIRLKTHGEFSLDLNGLGDISEGLTLVISAPKYKSRKVHITYEELMSESRVIVSLEWRKKRAETFRKPPFMGDVEGRFFHDL